MLLLRNDRVLLLRGHDPAEPDSGYWYTVGGTIAPDETPREAASRKLREDVGYAVDPAVFDQPIWCNTTQFSHNGVTYRQYQRFYTLEVDPETVEIALPAGHFDVDGCQWWSIAELRNTSERFYPPELPDLLARHMGAAG